MPVTSRGRRWHVSITNSSSPSLVLSPPPLFLNILNHLLLSLSTLHSLHSVLIMLFTKHQNDSLPKKENSVFINSPCSVISNPQDWLSVCVEHRSYQAECTSVSFPTDSEHNKYCILLKVSINAGTEIHNEIWQLKKETNNIKITFLDIDSH